MQKQKPTHKTETNTKTGCANEFIMQIVYVYIVCVNIFPGINSFTHFFFFFYFKVTERGLSFMYQIKALSIDW